MKKPTLETIGAASELDSDREFNRLKNAIDGMSREEKAELRTVLHQLVQSDEANPNSTDLMASLAEIGSVAAIVAGGLLWALGFPAGGYLITGAAPGLAGTITSTQELLEKKDRAKRLAILLQQLEEPEGRDVRLN